MKGRHGETANRRTGSTFPHQRGSSYNICQPLSSRGRIGPRGGVRLNRAQAPGSGTGGPDPSQSHASPAELQVSAEGGRLGAQHAPAWLRWGNRRGPAHSPSPPARAPGGKQATANRRAGHSKGPRGPSLTSRMGEAGLTSTRQAAGSPARKVGRGVLRCVHAHARA